MVKIDHTWKYGEVVRVRLSTRYMRLAAGIVKQQNRSLTSMTLSKIVKFAIEVAFQTLEASALVEPIREEEYAELLQSNRARPHGQKLEIDGMVKQMEMMHEGADVQIHTSMAQLPQQLRDAISIAFERVQQGGADAEDYRVLVKYDGLKPELIPKHLYKQTRRLLKSWRVELPEEQHGVL